MASSLVIAKRLSRYLKNYVQSKDSVNETCHHKRTSMSGNSKHSKTI